MHLEGNAYQPDGKPVPALGRLQAYTKDRTQAYFVIARTVIPDPVCGDSHYFVVAPSNEPPYWCLYQSFGTQSRTGYTVNYYLNDNDYETLSNSDAEEKIIKKAKKRYLKGTWVSSVCCVYVYIIRSDFVYSVCCVYMIRTDFV